MPSKTKTALITGANRGLGLALATELTERGWRVIGTARAPHDAAALSATGATIVGLDVGDEHDIATLAKRVTQHCDGLSLLVNNAGVGKSGGPSGPSSWPLAALTSSGLIDVLRINTVAPILITAQLAPLLLPESWVVSMSSKLGSMTLNFGTDFGYNTSKAALNMATVLIAKELASRNVGAVAVHPGWVRTDMGGPTADLSPHEAMQSLATTLESLSIEQSGRFIDWLGRPMPW
jgi:NAD(P)-dependent dehydrogenase (short-subunit alcohol dehydrogenase family)